MAADPGGDVPVDGSEHRPSVLEGVRSVLEEARAVGFLGPGPVDAQLAHAQGFLEALELAWTKGRAGRLGPLQESSGLDRTASATDPTVAGEHGAARQRRVADLGSGGGLPGLVLGGCWSDVEVVLVESQQRRARFLDEAARRLGIGAHVRVACERAELLGREAAHRGAYDAVVARSFGPPATTAECAAPLLRVGGVLVTSSPPPGREGRAEADAAPRWPAKGLALLGMEAGEAVGGQYRFQVVHQVHGCPNRYPRRDGMPRKRPLF